MCKMFRSFITIFIKCFLGLRYKTKIIHVASDSVDVDTVAGVAMAVGCKLSALNDDE